jgi:Flp pilus assembly protein TadB
VRKRQHAPEQPVYSVTSAPQSLQDDQSYRMHRYLLSMGTRTVCFLLAVLFIAVLHWTVAGWFMVAGAVLLPYFAVVMANVSRSRFSAPLGPVTPSHRAVEGTNPPRPEDGQPGPRRTGDGDGAPRP